MNHNYSLGFTSKAGFNKFNVYIVSITMISTGTIVAPKLLTANQVAINVCDGTKTSSPSIPKAFKATRRHHSHFLDPHNILHDNKHSILPNLSTYSPKI